MRTLGDEESSEQHQGGRKHGGGVHPPPSRQTRILSQHQKAYGCSHQRADGLEAEGGKNQAAATPARRAFGNHQMRRRVVAAESKPHSEQADDQPGEILGEHDRNQEQNEQQHFDDEHRLAAKSVGKAAQCAGPDQDAEQAGGADQAVLARGQVEFLADQRQGDASHEDHHPLEEFARHRQPPDSPLHPRHRRALRQRSVGPLRCFVDIALDGVYARGRRTCCHWVLPQSRNDAESGNPNRETLMTRRSRRRVGSMQQQAAIRDKTHGGCFANFDGIFRGEYRRVFNRFENDCAAPRLQSDASM